MDTLMYETASTNMAIMRLIAALLLPVLLQKQRPSV